MPGFLQSICIINNVKLVVIPVVLRNPRIAAMSDISDCPRLMAEVNDTEMESLGPCRLPTTPRGPLHERHQQVNIQIEMHPCLNPYTVSLWVDLNV